MFDNRIHNHGRVIIFERDGSAGLSCIAFGESFANHLLVFLKESFRRLVFVHTSTMIGEILANERPDIVLSLPLEQFLIHVPADHDAMSRFVATVSEKLSENRILDRPDTYLLGIPRALQPMRSDQIGRIPW